MMRLAGSFLVATAFLLMIGMPGVNGVACAADGLLPLPSKDEARVATAKVREIFAADAARAKTPDAKKKLAVELLGHARETDAPVDQYVLLEAARSLAMEAGDVAAVTEALQMIADRFAINLASARITALEDMAAKAPAASLGSIADRLLEAAGEFENEADVAKAEDLAESALAAARRGKDRDRQKKAVDRLAQIRERRKLLGRAKPLEEKLAANPGDREAAAELGRFRCFVENDWESGLPLLVRGDDPALAALAQAEANVARDSSNRMALADNWWAFATSAKGADAAAAEGRARLHYGMLLEGLAGLERARVVKRLESATSNGSAGSAKRPNGLILWLDASMPGAVRGPDGQPIQLSKGMKEAPIAAWADMPTGRPMAVQKNPSFSPVFQAEAFGSRPGVVFRGSQWFTTDVASPKQGTLAVVFRIDSTAVHTRVIGAVGESAGVRLQTRVGGKMGGEISAGGPSADEVWSPEEYLREGMSVVSVLTWPSPFRMHLDGKSHDAIRPQQSNPSGGRGMVLGAYSDKGGIAFQGAIGEAMLFDRVLSPQEIASLQGSLAAKWAVR
jgi:hypothetical protein